VKPTALGGKAQATRRVRKVLHAGGVGWNAYLNAKLMEEIGDIPHVAANDIYHCVSSPEWHELADKGLDRSELGDDFFPNFFRIAASRDVRPRWFAQGTQFQVIAYLFFLARGETAVADAMWDRLQYSRFKTVIFRDTTPDHHRLDEAAFEAELKRLHVAPNFHDELRRGFERERLVERFASVVSRLPPDIASIVQRDPPYWREHVDLVCSFEDNLAAEVAAARADGSNFTSGLEKPDWRLWPEQRSGRRMLGLTDHDLLLERVRRRNLAISDEDAGIYGRVIPEWNMLVPLYDQRVLYGGSPIIGLQSNSPHYFAYEHGTIRSIPFEDNATGRLIRAAYEQADGVFITNGDYITAQHRLEFKPSRRTYLPHAFDERPLIAFAQANRPKVRRPGPVRFFQPSRQDWVSRQPGSKANDLVVEAAALLVSSGQTDFEVTLVEWGPDVEATRALIAENGVSAHFNWVKPMARNALWKTYLQADAVIDQFVLSSMSGVSYETLTFGIRTITFDDGVSNKTFFGESPPLLSARTADEIADRLREVIADPDDLKGVGAASRQWMLKYHSAERFLSLQYEQFERIEAREARAWTFSGRLTSACATWWARFLSGRWLRRWIDRRSAALSRGLLDASLIAQQVGAARLGGQLQAIAFLPLLAAARKHGVRAAAAFVQRDGVGWMSPALLSQTGRGKRAPAGALLMQRSFGPGAVETNEFWTDAGASVGLSPLGAVVTTPPVDFFYAANVQLDYSGIDFDASDVYVRARLAGVSGEIRVSVYHPETDQLAAEQIVGATKGVALISLPVPDPAFDRLLIRSSHDATRAAQTIVVDVQLEAATRMPQQAT
jgi:hypothetical protein